jgi:hypothetical protein
MRLTSGMAVTYGPEYSLATWDYVASLDRCETGLEQIVSLHRIIIPASIKQGDHSVLIE